MTYLTDDAGDTLRFVIGGDNDEGFRESFGIRHKSLVKSLIGWAVPIMNGLIVQRAGEGVKP